MGGVKIGAEVDIQRSNGRIHSAVVSGVNSDSLSVTVEWFEGGETKGKEIDLESIFRLNEELMPSTPAPPLSSGRPQRKSTATGALAAGRKTGITPPQPALAKSEATFENTVTGNINSRRNPARQSHVITAGGNIEVNGTTLQHGRREASYDRSKEKRGLANNRSNGLAATANGSNREVKPKSPRPGKGSLVQASRFNEGRKSPSRTSPEPAVKPSKEESLMPPPRPVARRRSPRRPSSPEPVRKSRPTQSPAGEAGAKQRQEPETRRLEPAGQVKARPTARSPVAETVSKPSTSAAAASTKRRSGVVKEVEKMQVARDRRRAVQAATVMEQEQRGRGDASNPNWEFQQMIDDYKEDLDLQPLQDGDPVANNRITVCIRKRPLSSKEEKAKDVDVVTVASRDHVMIHEPKTKVDLTKFLENQQFRFDCVFDDSSTNETVYKYTARNLVHSIFEGGMATCFAYGQTGSGKTHTMGGEFKGKNQDCSNGIYALATRDVFQLLYSSKHAEKNLVVSCSYFEIYGGKVFDLLSGKSKLKVMEDGKQQVVVVGLTETEVASVDDVLALITRGNNLRTSGKTSANSNSSRSHAVFQILLRTDTRRRPLHGKFSLIDLAGNERGAVSSSADRQTRLEGAEINKSLLALKECIRALGRKGAHLPFRASKLTQVLRDSFIGERTRTCMIAMIGPSMASCEHTLNTLRYADRVKELCVGESVEQGIDFDEAEEEGEEEEEADGSLEQSGLAQLQTLAGDECNEDWVQYQESLAVMQVLEEEVVEAHRNMVDGLEVWRQQDAILLAMTNTVDYDQEAYAQLLEEMVREKQEVLADLALKAKAFRECLAEEEAEASHRRG